MELSYHQTVFSETKLSKLEQSLIQTFSDVKGTVIFERATAILNSELENIDDRGNRAVHKHLNDSILPGFSCYKALIESGVNSSEAKDFVEKELCESAKRMGDFMNKFKKVPFAYGLLRILIKPFMKKGYPKEGWTVIWIENSKNKISFHITSCLYCEELKKRNAFELCPAFCVTDHIAYDPLSPKIIFKRKGTLAEQGRKVCDFSFEKEGNAI